MAKEKFVAGRTFRVVLEEGAPYLPCIPKPDSEQPHATLRIEKNELVKLVSVYSIHEDSFLEFVVGSLGAARPVLVVKSTAERCMLPINTR